MCCPGSITATVQLDGPAEWPRAVANCAVEAGARLPELRPAGNPVRWEVATGTLITADSVDSALRPGGTVTYTYHVIAPPPLPNGPNVSEELRIKAIVQRDDTRELEERLVQLIRGELDRLFNHLRDVLGSPASPCAIPTPTGPPRPARRLPACTARAVVT